MKITRVTQPVNVAQIKELSAEMAKANSTSFVAPGAKDPWRQLAIAVAKTAPTMAHACYSASPIRKHRADVKELIKQVMEYHNTHQLPMSAQVPLAIGALIIGIEATGL